LIGEPSLCREGNLRSRAAMIDDVAVTGPARRSWLTTLLLAFGVGSAYMLCRRLQAHGSDIFTLSRWLDEPDFVHPHHPLYLPGAELLSKVLTPFGVERMTMFSCYSALGAAVGVAAIHRAVLRWTGDAALALVVALTSAATPALTYFATIGELHAPFFAWAGLAWWACAVWCATPGFAGALRCGVLAGVATLFHATGALLVPWLAGAWMWMRRADGLSALFRQAGLFGVTAFLVWLLGFSGMRALGEVPAGQPLELVAERFDVWVTLAAFPRTWLVDWWLPFAPCSVLVLWCFWRGLAWPALWLHAAVLVHVLFTAVMLRGGGHEFGAYDLPLVLPLVLLSCRALPRRLWWGLPVLALTASVAHRLAYPRPLPDLEFGWAAVAFTAEAPTVYLVGDEMETQGLRWFEPRVELIEAWVFQVQLGAAARDFPAEQVVGWLRWQLQNCVSQGRRLLVTDLAIHNLSEWIPQFASGWQQFVAGADIQREASLKGFWVRPRQ